MLDLVDERIIKVNRLQKTCIIFRLRTNVFMLILQQRVRGGKERGVKGRVSELGGSASSTLNRELVMF